MSLAGVLACEEENDGLVVFLVPLLFALIHCFFDIFALSFADNEVGDLIVAQSVGYCLLFPFKSIFLSKRL